MAAYFQRTRDLVKNPKNLLGVLQNLVGKDQISLTIRERQIVALNIGYVNLIRLSGQGLWRIPFPLRLRSVSPAGEGVSRSLGLFPIQRPNRPPHEGR